MIVKQIMHNVFLAKRQEKDFLVTKSKYPSRYGEKKYGEYREWIASRSKLAAMILNGYVLKIQPEWRVLYLGAASGTTVSHLADIVDEGIIYAVEYSAKPFAKFLQLAEERRNIIPLLKDASKPWDYSGIVEKVDLIYQDIARKDQIKIFSNNADLFLKKSGNGLIMVKARSIDSTAELHEVFSRVIDELEARFSIIAQGSLEPFYKDHMYVHVKA